SVLGAKSGVSVNVSGAAGPSSDGHVSIHTFAVQQLPGQFDLLSLTASQFALPGGMFAVGDKTGANGTGGTIVSGSNSATTSNAGRIVASSPFTQGNISIQVTGGGVTIDQGSGTRPIESDSAGVRTKITPGQALAVFQVSRGDTQTIGLND